jgi:hypothetical protein
VAARPILEDEVADAYLLIQLASLADVQQFIILRLLLQFVLQFFLLVQVLLLGLVLPLHLLHPSSVQFVKIGKLLQMH